MKITGKTIAIFVISGLLGTVFATNYDYCMKQFNNIVCASEPDVNKHTCEYKVKLKTEKEVEHKSKFSESDIDKIVDWAYKNSKSYIPKRDVRQIIEETTKYDLCLIILAVMKEESRFDRYARSSKNALGLCQIMGNVWFETLKKKGIVKEKIDFFDYTNNIAAANYILNEYYAKDKCWKKALNRYVNGSSHYVMNVLSNYAELKFVLGDV